MGPHEAKRQRPHTEIRSFPTFLRFLGMLWKALIRGNGARGRNRTADTVIFSHVLYQLSYPGVASEVKRAAPIGTWNRACPALFLLVRLGARAGHAIAFA